MSYPYPDNNDAWWEHPVTTPAPAVSQQVQHGWASNNPFRIPAAPPASMRESAPPSSFSHSAPSAGSIGGAASQTGGTPKEMSAPKSRFRKATHGIIANMRFKGSSGGTASNSGPSAAVTDEDERRAREDLEELKKYEAEKRELSGYCLENDDREWRKAKLEERYPRGAYLAKSRELRMKMKGLTPQEIAELEASQSKEYIARRHELGRMCLEQGDRERRERALDDALPFGAFAVKFKPRARR
ncbi:hypothetical protein MNV49_007140 [Pseudohyphozyma bogoriensis]|nr:hypothetical protein MNV49_007140 [Pseudohyphozyma bogoriensis]